jgi:tight adherence protein C
LVFLWRFSQQILRFIPYQASNRLLLQQRLSKAGIYDLAMTSKFLAAKLLMIVVPLAISLVIALTSPLRFDVVLLSGCMLSALGAILPGLWLDRQVAQRHRMLRRSLPDFLDLMIVCLEGGLSIQESVRRVGDELQLAHPSLATELSIVQRDIEFGSSVAQALKRFAIRTQYEAVRRLASFVREAQRFGTNLSQALRLHSDMLRMQREQAAEEAAQKAAVKILLPTLLLIFPAIFVVLVGPALIQIQEAFAVK